MSWLTSGWRWAEGLLGLELVFAGVFTAIRLWMGRERQRARDAEFKSDSPAYYRVTIFRARMSYVFLVGGLLALGFTGIVCAIQGEPGFGPRP